jgi:alcohol dehydrogenase class IV
MRGALPQDAGDALAGRVIEMMRAAGMPNGLSDLGFTDADVDALAIGSEPQYRVIRNAPKDVSREDLKDLFRAAMKYW